MNPQHLCQQLDLCHCIATREQVEWIFDSLMLAVSKCPDGNYTEWYNKHRERCDAHFGSLCGFTFFCNWATNKGYLEHGSAVSASWLTPNGQQIKREMSHLLTTLPTGDDWDVA